MKVVDLIDGKEITEPEVGDSVEIIYGPFCNLHGRILRLEDGDEFHEFLAYIELLDGSEIEVEWSDFKCL